MMKKGISDGSKARPRRKKVILPGMYKPTKKKEHKVLGHKGADMRKKKKEEGSERKPPGEIASA